MGVKKGWLGRLKREQNIHCLRRSPRRERKDTEGQDIMGRSRGITCKQNKTKQKELNTMKTQFLTVRAMNMRNIISKEEAAKSMLTMLKFSES